MIAVLPILIGMGIGGVIGWVIWSIHRFPTIEVVMPAPDLVTVASVL